MTEDSHDNCNDDSNRNEVTHSSTGARCVSPKSWLVRPAFERYLPLQHQNDVREMTMTEKRLVLVCLPVVGIPVG